METMKALLKTGPHTGMEVREIPVPVIGDDEVLVETKAVGICGSDVHMYNWTSAYEWMIPHLPLSPGHEYSGQVVKTGKNVTKVKVGDRVVCRFIIACGNCPMCQSNRRFLCINGLKRQTGLNVSGGMAKYSVQPEDGVIVLPDNISYEQAALIEPMSVTVNAVAKANILFGDVCVVYGPGPIGLLTLMFARASGAGTLVMIGTSADKERLAIAKEMGADYVMMSDVDDVKGKIMELTDGLGADIIFESTGAASVVQSALDILTKTGTLMTVSIYSKPVQTDMTTMVRSAQNIMSSYLSGDVTWERIIRWLSSNDYYAKQAVKIVTHRTKIDDADVAFARCNQKQNIKEMFVNFD